MCLKGFPDLVYADLASFNDMSEVCSRTSIEQLLIAICGPGLTKSVCHPKPVSGILVVLRLGASISREWVEQIFE